jgi:tetratricopeptide (TPR) repeat protein
VLACLAYALYLQPDSYERRVELCREAVAMARHCGDPVTLRWVLNNWRWALWGPDTIEERLNIAAELVQLAERTGDREMALSERAWRLIDLLELGDIVGVDVELETFTRGAFELKPPWFEWYVNRFSAMLAMLEGRFADAERFAEAAMTSPKRSQHQDAHLIYVTQLLNIRIQQGRLDELEGEVQSFVTQYPSMTIWKYVVPYMHSELGRAAEARAELERFMPTDRLDLRNDYTRLQAATYLTETCAYLGDAARAARLYEQLLPYERHCVVVAYGIACFGSVARYLGLLAATIGDRVAAGRHYENAMSVNLRMRARPFLARTQHDYARLLLKAGEIDKARGLLGAALETARELGMKALEKAVEATVRSDDRLQQTANDRPLAAVAEPTALHARFRLTGEYWSIRFAGTTFQLKALLGLTYIAYLLRNPGGEFHVTDLVDLAEGTRAPAATAHLPRETMPARSLGDAGEVLDAQAKAEYRRRLAELREEIEEAEGFNDIGRIDRAREEMEALSEQLAQGVGLGGRERRVASHVERARVSVTKCIGVAVKKIAGHDPALAVYLRDRIKTGTLCGYVPDPGRPVRWEL